MFAFGGQNVQKINISMEETNSIITVPPVSRGIA